MASPPREKPSSSGYEPAVLRILASRSGGGRVRAGDVVEAVPDRILSTDIATPLVIEAYRAMGAGRSPVADRVVLVEDHLVPSRDAKAAELARRQADWAGEIGGARLFPAGCGIGHSLLREEGLVRSGDLLLGADSHTLGAGAVGAMGVGLGATDIAAAVATGRVWLRAPETIPVVLRGQLPPGVCSKDVALRYLALLGHDGASYAALEFLGDGLRSMSRDGRAALCIMAAECGAKTALAAPRRDPDRARGPGYRAPVEIDLGGLAPQVSRPDLPTNGVPVTEVEGKPVHRILVGSCAGGSLEDLADLAGMLRGHRVHPDVRLVVLPGTRRVLLKAMASGVARTLVEAGAVLGPPSCGPCIGSHLGVAGPGETVLATMPRNYRGRMGSAEADVYLCGPLVAGASARTGRITDPRREPAS